MLLRPKHPLPRKFNRRVSGATRKFVERRQQRHKQYTRERWKRMARRSHHILMTNLLSLRRWLWVAVAIAVAFGIAFLAFSPMMHVREIRVARTDPRLDAERIQQVLKPLFGRHLFFLSDREVEARIKNALPDVQTVSVEKQYPSQVLLTISLHPIVARLSIDAPDATSTTPATPEPAASGDQQPQTYDYLTDNGLYVKIASAQSGAVLPTIHIIDWAVHPSPLMPLFSAELLQRMQEAETALTQQFGLTITSRTVYVRAREFHLATKNFSLWFDLASPLADQLQRYRTFLKSVPIEQVHQYVDLRLVGRIVYR